MSSSWIKNNSLLTGSDLRRDALMMAEAALDAIDTKVAIKRTVKMSGNKLDLDGNVYDLSKIHRIFLCGVGKCALTAAREIEVLLGDKINGGVVIGLDDDQDNHYFNYYRGTHPLPSEANVEATTEMIHLLKEVRSDDLVIFIVSGGGSTLLCQPKKGDLSLSDEQKIFVELTKRGATIQELNTIRKHLSLARGGFLAKYSYPAQIATLIFSDVPGSDLGFIASGPFILDETNVYHADFILDKYNIRRLMDIDFEQLIETPKDKKYFSRVKNTVVVSNERALNAAATKARELGYLAVIGDNKLSGEARSVGETIVSVLKQSPKRTALFYGGETTVTVCGRGKGGRNRELALASLSVISDDSLILTLASDGRDNGEVAGAVVDKKTQEKSQVLGLDPKKYLKDNDSGTFFETIGDEIKTGPTGINVADIIIALKK